MPRIYLPIIHIKESLISITGGKAHYLISVLRCRKGDELIVFDGEYNCLRTTILKADRREVVTEVIEKSPCITESHINITLVQGLLKGEKMDMVVRKTTELGVKEIIPVVTERSQLRETRKVARWRKIAEEASRQSGRTIIPTLYDAMEFKEFFSKQTCINHLPQPLLVKEGIKNGGFIFYEEGGMRLSEAVEILKQIRYTPLHPPENIRDQEGIISSLPAGEGMGDSELLIIIGPEGGFTKEEVTLAKEKGLVVTSLGERILRAETAAISAVTLVQFLLGDMG